MTQDAIHVCVTNTLTRHIRCILKKSNPKTESQIILMIDWGIPSCIIYGQMFKKKNITEYASSTY